MSAADEAASRAAFTQDHLTTLLRFIPRRDEAARAAAYDLGRRAFGGGISLIEVCRTHGDAVLELMRESPEAEQLDVASAGADLLLDLVAAYDMTHPGPDAVTPSP
ncbi:phosphatase RsbU N-terminal domain-containing protein [Humibacillus xanthopallidus]|uniref:Phosphoserine phosphatase RsbU-like protein n=1 Tax=Humibacillus xanthopallidus TaxID=412689 RepID=A0A543HWD9_9MICO|nr:phosphatase RsbU N-terminal domain-containing protein [Humibacillus xanthopallidus]TQM62678.1 phosphoserine phosphatase RsbU-like protein [Humibacillus xanthopallidus]